MHKWIVWDKDWNVKYISQPWSFMDGEVEFCAGMTEYNGDLMVTFGFQDNGAFLLKIPKDILIKTIGWTI